MPALAADARRLLDPTTDAADRRRKRRRGLDSPRMAADSDAAAAADGRARELLALADWRRRVAELYRRAREAAEPDQACRSWRAGRDDLFAHHPQSPLGDEERASFRAIEYFDYDPSARVLADGRPGRAGDARHQHEPGRRLPLHALRDRRVRARRRRPRARALLAGGVRRRPVSPVRRRDERAETYGGGRYLLDTVKGADLGTEGDRLVLDFNFAYNPSCAYDPRWVCPLSPPANRLPVGIRAGERVP